jgi:lysyl-tRNA synthetase class 2
MEYNILVRMIEPERLEKYRKITERDGNCFSRTRYPKTEPISVLVERFAENAAVATAGRLIAKREHGKSGFAHIADAGGKIQFYAQVNTLGETAFELYKQLELGDIVGVKGRLFLTRTGEKTVLAEELVLLAKALSGLPEKWHGLKDVETRYRRRYLDLIANREVVEVFVRRARIVDLVRGFFSDEGYLEVETPMLHRIPGGASGSAFQTHHNANDMDVYLRIAPELFLKRLLVGGLERVFEINRSFRNEGTSARHNPEFTMLEAYCAYRGYEYMMDACEKLFCAVAQDLHRALVIEYQGKRIDFTPPWPRLSFAGLFQEEFGVEPADGRDEVVEKVSKKLTLQKGLSRSQIIKITEEIIERKFPADKPAFIVDYFTWTSPLAKRKKDNPYLVERFELFVAGIEAANAYSELNDPIEQRRRLEQQLSVEEELPKRIDEDFLTALEHGMPPAAGLGIGIDRLVMIMLNQPAIRDVILFPLLKNIDE